MQNRGNIRDSVEKYGVKKKRAGHIKNTYSRYFEGYAEAVILKKNGKSGIRRFYVGDYYRQSLSDRQLILVKAGYFLAFLLATSAFIISGTRPVMVNRLVYIAVVQAFCVLFLGWMGIALLDYVPAHRKQTIYEYKASSRALIRGTYGLFISACLLSGGCILYMLRHMAEMDVSDTVCVLGYLIMTVIAGIVNRTERKIVYEQIPGCGHLEFADNEN